MQAVRHAAGHERGQVQVGREQSESSVHRHTWHRTRGHSVYSVWVTVCASVWLHRPRTHGQSRAHPAGSLTLASDRAHATLRTRSLTRLLLPDRAPARYSRAALRAIARAAQAKGTGTRGLRCLMENLLVNTMFELPDCSLPVRGRRGGGREGQGSCRAGGLQPAGERAC